MSILSPTHSPTRIDNLCTPFTHIEPSTAATPTGQNGRSHAPFLRIVCSTKHTCRRTGPQPARTEKVTAIEHTVAWRAEAKEGSFSDGREDPHWAL